MTILKPIFKIICLLLHFHVTTHLGKKDKKPLLCDSVEKINTSS